MLLVRYRIAAIAAITVCLLPFDAQAFCRAMTCNPAKETCDLDERGCVTSGTALRWPAERMPLVFRFQQQHSARLIPEETTAAVRAAFHRWSDVVCPDGRRTSLRFVEGEDLVADKPLAADATRPEPFGIYFRDRGWPHPSGDDQTALTTIDFAPSSGTILYADIEVNTTVWLYATRDVGEGIDLQTVVTHEVGHFIGLAHGREPNTIMAARLCDSGDRCARDRVSSRRLADDDIAAVCALYPPGVEGSGSAPALPSTAPGACAVHAAGASPPARPRALLVFAVVLAGLEMIRRKTRNRASRSAE